MSDVELVALADAKATIARAMVDDRESIPAQLGRVTLRAHQRAAAARLTSLISLNGGAMLAEPVGLGKTYTSLAVAECIGESLLIATPASLTRMWSDAVADTGINAELVTHEALSRGAVPAIQPRVVIVDEAHRLKSSSARRYARRVGRQSERQGAQSDAAGFSEADGGVAAGFVEGRRGDSG